MSKAIRPGIVRGYLKGLVQDIQKKQDQTFSNVPQKADRVCFANSFAQFPFSNKDIT